MFFKALHLNTRNKLNPSCHTCFGIHPRCQKANFYHLKDSEEINAALELADYLIADSSDSAADFDTAAVDSDKEVWKNSDTADSDTTVYSGTACEIHSHTAAAHLNTAVDSGTAEI